MRVRKAAGRRETMSMQQCDGECRNAVEKVGTLYETGLRDWCWRCEG